MVKIVVGLMGSSVAKGSSQLAAPTQLRALLQACRAHNITALDTARVYNGGKSEELLGSVSDARSFSIHTKAPGFSPGSLTYDRVVANCEASLTALQQDSIDLYYFHGPDSETPIEESCKAMNYLYEHGKIKKFGISNYRAEQVETIVQTCQRHNWILPTVYQGGYNPLIRGSEESLFPTLRAHGIAFYAYSPLGGGYFSRPIEQLREPRDGRMVEMSVFKQIYVNDDSLRLHELLENACAREVAKGGQIGISMRDATLRWFRHHAPLGDDDAVVLGASTVEQLEENLGAFEAGPLSTELAAVFEQFFNEYRATGRPVGL